MRGRFGTTKFTKVTQGMTVATSFAGALKRPARFYEAC